MRKEAQWRKTARLVDLFGRVQRALVAKGLPPMAAHNLAHVAVRLPRVVALVDSPLSDLDQSTIAALALIEKEAMATA